MRISLEILIFIPYLLKWTELWSISQSGRFKQNQLLFWYRFFIRLENFYSTSPALKLKVKETQLWKILYLIQWTAIPFWLELLKLNTLAVRQFCWVSLRFSNYQTLWLSFDFGSIRLPSQAKRHLSGRWAVKKWWGLFEELTICFSTCRRITFAVELHWKIAVFCFWLNISFQFFQSKSIRRPWDLTFQTPSKEARTVIWDSHKASGFISSASATTKIVIADTFS